MNDPNIIQFLSLSSSVAPWVVMKKVWKGLADKHILEGAMKVISSQAMKIQSRSPQTKLQFTSKSVWKLGEYRSFVNGSAQIKTTKTWPVMVDKMGTFIVAATDFKNLQVAEKNIAVEMITSSTENEKCFIAVRLTNSEDNRSQHELEDKLRQVVNDILCKDYENFIGYVLYKRIDVNMDNDDITDENAFDWRAEIFIKRKDTGFLERTLVDCTRELCNDAIALQYGVFQDGGVLSGRKVPVNL